MAAHLRFLLLLLLLHLFSFLGFVSVSQAQVTVLPVTKDASTLQYLTEIRHGSPLVPTKIVVDLGGPFLWMGCESLLGSSSRRLVSSGSIQCLAAKPKKARNHGGSSTTTPKPEEEDDDACTLFPENKIAQVGSRGELVEEIVAVRLVDRSKSGEVNAGELYSFLFACAPKSLLNGLASGVKGMLGLGRTRIALPSQISAAFDSKWQFALCLSSSDGVVLQENGHYSSYFGSEISSSLSYTPLLTGQGDDSEHEYFINLKSIRIGGKRLSFDIEKTKLSTIVPFTTVESSIYAIFIKAYEKAALSLNMRKVESVAPFGLCFDSKTIRNGQLGPEVPDIDLGLQSEMVRWRIHGRNSMVKVSDEVMCLGFLDGGLNLGVSIVLGGYQFEDMVIHFDLGTSMLGFSPSLLKWQTRCSDFKLDSIPLDLF